MKKRFAFFGGGMAPLAQTLRQSVAARIGRTITRHTYLDWILAKIVYSLLGISIKQARVAVRLPPPSRYIAMVQDLLLFHKLYMRGFNFRAFKTTIEDADR